MKGWRTGIQYREKDSLRIIRENLDLYLDAGDSLRFQSSETFNSPYETPYEHEKIYRRSKQGS